MAPSKSNNKTEGNKNSSSNKGPDHQSQSKGDIEELPMYTFGSKNNSATYTNSYGATENYVGREYGKAMTLIIKGKEAPPNYLLHPTNHWIPLKLLVQHNEEHMTKGSITTTDEENILQLTR